MIIDTDEWLTVKQFGLKVGRKSPWIMHYINNGTLDTIRIGNQWFIHLDCVGKWPPKPKKIGRPLQGNKQI